MADTDALDSLETLVDRWVTVPAIVEHLGVPLGRVRRMLDEHELVGVRRGSPRVLSVPAALVEPEPLPALAGTVTVLRDAGYDDVQTLVWLFTRQESLAATPVESLRAGRKTEIRRRAQLLAF